MSRSVRLRAANGRRRPMRCPRGPAPAPEQLPVRSLPTGAAGSDAPRVQVQGERRNDDGAAGLVAALVLVKSDVRIARCLADVEAPRERATPVLEEGDVEVMRSSLRLMRCRSQPQCRAVSLDDPTWRGRAHGQRQPCGSLRSGHFSQKGSGSVAQAHSFLEPV